MIRFLAIALMSCFLTVIAFDAMAAQSNQGHGGANAHDVNDANHDREVDRRDRNTPDRSPDVEAEPQDDTPTRDMCPYD